ncbi:MAG: hypothetical protein HY861_02490 [Chlamydiia bacterium]|nr:hypothetical protein [Chlamydiia bacterium]
MKRKFFALLSFIALIPTLQATITWSPEVQLTSGSALDFDAVAFAENGSGYAVALWVESNVLYSLKRIDGTWESSPVSISPSGAGITRPQIAMDALGNTMAIWLTVVGGFSVIDSAYRTGIGSSSWSSPIIISDPCRDSLSQTLVMSATGLSVATWKDAATGNLYSSTGTFGPFFPIWSTPLQITADSVSGFTGLAIDASQQATALWKTSAGAVKAAELPFAGTWQNTATLAAANGQDVALSANGAGDVLAVWSLTTGAAQAAEKAAGSSVWSSASTLSGVGADADQIASSLASDGSAVALWRNQELGQSIIQGATSVFGSAWNSAADLLPSYGSYSFPAARAVSSQNVIAIWVDGTNRTVQSSYLNGLTEEWASPVDVSTDLVTIGETAGLQTDSSGNPTTVWQGSGVYSASGTFASLGPLAPASGTGRQRADRFASQADLINTLSWQTSVGAVSYRVYLGSTSSPPLTTVTNPSFSHHRIPPGRTMTYYITAVDIAGNESSALQIVVRPS